MYVAKYCIAIHCIEYEFVFRLSSFIAHSLCAFHSNKEKSIAVAVHVLQN